MLYIIGLILIFGYKAIEIYKLDRREMVLSSKGVEGKGVVLGEWFLNDSLSCVSCIIYAMEIKEQVYVNSDFFYGRVDCSPGDTIGVFYSGEKNISSILNLPDYKHANIASPIWVR